MLKILDAKLELRSLAENWLQWSREIAEAAKEIAGSCELYVFGSVAEKRVTGASDVDILIVCDQLPKGQKARGNIKAKIEETANLPPSHPFEIHLVDRSDASWYFRHIKRMIKIEHSDSP